MAAGSDSTKHIAAARRRLGHLAGLEAETAAVERKILQAAEDRLAAVQADLERLRPRATMPGSEAAARYEELTLERGHLSLVIAQARQELGL